MWPKMKLIQAYIVDHFACKKEEDSFKNEGARVDTTVTDLSLYVYEDFSRHPRAINSLVCGWFCLKFKLIKAFMVILDTYKNEEDLIKMKALES